MGSQRDTDLCSNGKFHIAVQTSKAIKTYRPNWYSKLSRNRKNLHIKAITNEKRHSVEWKRCKNHDDVWSVIGASQSSGDRLFFPLAIGAAAELCLRALSSDSTGPLPRVPQHPVVFYEVKWDPPQKTRSAINYALTHSDSPIIYMIASNILFYGFFPVCREYIARFTISMQGANSMYLYRFNCWDISLL